MALTDLIKTARKVLRASALGLAVQGCGSEGSTGNRVNEGDRCPRLCSRVWNDCAGLPAASYSLGTSYNDCIQGCPAFIEGVRNGPFNEMDVATIDCVIYTPDCQQLEEDVCEMDEGDLFRKYSPYSSAAGQ